MLASNVAVAVLVVGILGMLIIIHTGSRENERAMDAQCEDYCVNLSYPSGDWSGTEDDCVCGPDAVLEDLP